MAMKKPTQYFLIHRTTKEYKPFFRYYSAPMRRDLCEWVPVGNGISEFRQVWDAFIDTRYPARLRLYNYLSQKSQTK